MTETIAAKSIVAAVNLINDYRSEVGLDPLDDLPKGRPGDVKRCILAKAFNFDCGVSPWGDPGNEDERYGGQIYFQIDELDKAELLAQLMGVLPPYDGGTYCTIELPQELAKIARFFDHNKLPEYVEDEKED